MTKWTDDSVGFPGRVADKPVRLQDRWLTCRTWNNKVRSIVDQHTSATRRRLASINEQTSQK